ncbi:hypothetical protein [Streptomyces chartreusis]|uniref:hypothetical protein n=1 Tax=Streptomyces chartreusis TaxID=1969 RepID=UPI0033BA444B
MRDVVATPGRGHPGATPRPETDDHAAPPAADRGQHPLESMASLPSTVTALDWGNHTGESVRPDADHRAAPPWADRGKHRLGLMAGLRSTVAALD